MKYLIGSRALNHWYPDEFPIKEDSDWDIVTDENIESNPTLHVDVCPKDLPTMDVCNCYLHTDTILSPVGYVNIVNPIGLMLIKRSHLHRPIGFEKHIRHYHFLSKEYLFNQYHDYYVDLLEKLTLATKQKYGDKTPKLNKSKKEFFDDYVKKVYDHDDIHYATCFYDKPIYEELKTDADKVWCSEKKWACIPHTRRVQCVAEECFTIAIERFLIPNRKFPPRFAFSKALTKVCTTLTSGWFRDYAIEYWPEVMEYSNSDFYERFLSKEKQLKPYGDSNEQK